jgi:hypothetical protein
MNLTDRVAKLLGEQPWPGYDEQDAGASRPSSIKQTPTSPGWTRAMSATTRIAPTSSKRPSAASIAGQASLSSART